MKKIFSIYKSDLKKILTSWVLIVVSLALIILPALYAWLNIYASWDPYSNTKGIKVAVVNQDIGANFKSMDFDIGAELIASLKTNDKLGWVFCDNIDEAIKMAELGKVYATIVIPSDFSTRMTTIVGDNPVSPSIEYYVNEKTNAIAPKITDSAANTLQNQITSSIIKTAVTKAFEKFNEIGVKVDKRYPEIKNYIDLLFALNENFPQVDGKLENLTHDVKNGVVRLNEMNEDFAFVQTTLDDVIDFNENFSGALLDLDVKIKEYSPEIRENLVTAKSLFQNISNATGSLADKITNNKPDAIRKIGYAIDDLNELQNKVDSLSKKLSTFNEEDIPEIVQKNQELSEDINSLSKTLQDLKRRISNNEDILDLLYTLTDLTSDLSNDLDALDGKIDALFDKYESILTKAENISKSIDVLIKSANLPITLASSIINDINYLKESIDTNASFYSNLVNTCTQIKSDLQQIIAGQSLALSDIKSNNSSLGLYISNMRTNLDSKKSDIKNTISNISSLSKQISRVSDDLSSAIYFGSKNVLVNINNLITRLTGVEKALDTANEKLLDSQDDNREKIKTKTNSILSKTSELKTSLEELKQYSNDEDSFEKSLYDIQKLSSEITASLETVTLNLDDNILPRIENYLKNGSIFIGNINKILKNTNADIEVLKDFLSDVSDDGAVSIDKINKVREKLPGIQRTISDISKIVENVNKTIGFDDLIKFLQNDAAVEGDFLSSPIKLNTHKLYNMVNYGTGLSPFYSVLALWVGALFLVSLLSTESTNLDVAFRPVELFFGKFLLFATIGVLQGLIISLGDVFILGISVHNPVLFILLSVFYSLVFTMMVYSLVSTTGNIGKGIAVIIMLLQITGSGGTFPVQVLPSFFQVIHAFLPFTYAIGAMREAIYGVVYDTLVKDVGILFVFLGAFTSMGIFFKKPLNKLIRGLSKQVYDSNLIGH